MFGIKFNKTQIKVQNENGVQASTNAELEKLIEECREHLLSFNEQLIRKAFNLCLDAHKNKIRKSGNPYYQHPIAVAKIVVNEIPLDDISVASALLHDVLNYSDEYSIKDIRFEFGQTIAEIVDGITKIKHIESHNIDQLNQLENYRRLLLSLFKDVRIILIKLADRLHNMRTLEYLPPEKQKYIALETLEIYAPFANRFGLRNLKWELEDLAFKHLNRNEFDKIRNSLQGTRTEREEFVTKFRKPIEERLSKDEFLKKNNVTFEINGRAKHIFSIYNKMKLRQKSIEELYDLFAIRIILDTNDPFICFYVYGIVCSIFPPVPATFKDYISAPKKNGYQSIHTAVIGLDNKPVEVQFRTKTMHEISERGVAAHFRYKSGLESAQSVLEEENVQEWIDLVRQIFENAGEESQVSLLEDVGRNLFPDEIYLFTPTNEFITLPRDSTPLDFAFNIHSEIGYHCIGAKVNGRIVPLDYKLQTGDQVEILTSKNQKPSHDWLKLTVTPRAKSKINKFLNEEKKKMENEGKALWHNHIKNNGLSVTKEDFERLLQSFKLKNSSDFYLALISGEININKAFQIVQLKLKNGIDHTDDGIKNKTEYSNNNHNNNYVKTNLDVFGKISNFKDNNINMRFSPCCCPLPGDRIIGVAASRDTIIIHRKECNSISENLSNNKIQMIELNWNSLEQINFVSELKITGDDRPALLNDITTSILNCENTNIRGVSFDTIDSLFEGIITVNVQSLEHLNKLFDSIKAIAGIKSVERIMK